MSHRILVLSVLIFGSWTLCIQAAPVAAVPDYEALSGVWVGTVRTSQMGNCRFLDPSHGRAEALDGRVIISELQVAVSFRKNGSFSIQRVTGEPPEKREPNWTGVVHPDGSVVATHVSNVTCMGKQGELTVHQAGKLKIGKKWTVLLLEAKEMWCPNMGCRYLVRYRLRRRTDGREPDRP